MEAKLLWLWVFVPSAVRLSVRFCLTTLVVMDWVCLGWLVFSMFDWLCTLGMRTGLPLRFFSEESGLADLLTLPS